MKTSRSGFPSDQQVWIADYNLLTLNGLPQVPAVEQARRRLRLAVDAIRASAGYDALVTGILTGPDDVDLPGLTQRALIDAGAGLLSPVLDDPISRCPARLELIQALEHQVMAGLSMLYAPASRERWTEAAGLFDTAATEFAKLAAVVDVEAPADSMVTAATAQRTAWAAAPAVAERLTHLYHVVVAASRLDGLDCLDTAESMSLVLNMTGQSKRKLWVAWHTGEGLRCGRWGQLRKLGVTLKAQPITTFAPMLEPPPLQTLTVMDGGKQVTRVHDPLDAAPAAPAPSQR